EGAFEAGANREHHARAARTQEGSVNEVRVLEVLLELPTTRLRPEVRIEEVEDVLPLDRVVQELDDLALDEHLSPDTLAHDAALAVVEVLGQSRRYEREGGPEQPAQHALHDLLALDLAQAERILGTELPLELRQALLEEPAPLLVAETSGITDRG